MTRSQPAVLSTILCALLLGVAGTTTPRPARADEPGTAATAPRIDGAAAFAQNCQMCHQAGGVGLAGSFPRLAGRVAAISTKPAGRAYLIDVLTYGMSGTVIVDHQPLMGLMPPFAQLSAAEVAAILSHVQTLGTPPTQPPAPFGAAEIIAGREQPRKTAADVFAERKALETAKVIE